MSKRFITTMSQGGITERAEISVENIGGIESTEVSITPGVTVLEGENATNRTSLMQSIMAGLGSDDVTIKATQTRPSLN
jgi:recombinational DNA repair ATPase RecF